MKMGLIIVQVIAAVFFAAVAKAGPLDFVRDQLGVNATNFPFGSSPSAFPQFQKVKRVEQNPTEADYGYSLPSKSGPDRELTTTIFLHFTDNKLDWMEVSTGGKERNDKLVAEFAKLSGIDKKTITGPQPYEYSDGQYQLTYWGLCSASENQAAIFRLTKVETPK